MASTFWARMGFQLRHAINRILLAWAYKLPPLVSGVVLLVGMGTVVVTATGLYHGTVDLIAPVLQTWSAEAQGAFKALMWFGAITAGGRFLWKASQWVGEATEPMPRQHAPSFYEWLSNNGYRAVKHRVFAWEWWLVSSTLAPERLALVRADRLHRSLPQATPTSSSKERF